MRAGAPLAIALVAASVLAGCSVDRKTASLACTSQDTCTPMGRVCEMGYCVVDPNVRLDAAIDAPPPVCPASCNGGCTFGTTSMCHLNGTGGDVTCPAGFTCDITCTSTSACSSITCGNGDCTISCTGDAACGTISCTGAGACDVTCTGTGTGTAACGALTCNIGKCTESCVGSAACGDLSCASSCNCNASCSPADACATMTCPTKAGNKYCGQGGTIGQPCSSTAFPQCQSCP